MEFERTLLKSDFLTAQLFIPQIQFLADGLSEAINDRVTALVRNPMLQMATLLDPRFAYDDTIWNKNCWALIESELIEFAKKRIFPILGDLYIFYPKDLPPASDSTIINYELPDAENDPNKSIDNDESDQSISRMFMKILSIYIYFLDNIWIKPKSPGNVSIPSTLSGEIQPELAAKIECQFASYKAVKRPAYDDDLFSWWKINHALFPELATLAQMFHSIPATSVCSERLFSKAGIIYANSLRNR